jgi:predicted nucleotidyltransferase
MDLKELRKKGKLTQKEASQISGLPLRTYIRYENSKDKSDSIKYLYAKEKLEDYCTVTETKGLLSIEIIKESLEPILKENKADFCILFGSYAKNKATEKSDVDLLVKADIKGLAFYGFVEEISQVLHKKGDLLRVEDLKDNVELLSEIFKDGIKIYG